MMSPRPPTIRDRMREALSAREPDERTAQADLEAVLARRRPRVRTRPWVLVAIPAVCTIALLAWFGRRAPPTPGMETLAVYIHVAGEPEGDALTLQLESTKKTT